MSTDDARPADDDAPPGSSDDAAAAAPPPSAEPTQPAKPAVPDEALDRARAYQAAQRTSPWGYVFLLGLFGFLTGWAWYRVEEDPGFVTQAWIFISALLTLAPLAWHSVDFFQTMASRRGGAFAAVVVTVTLSVVVMGALTALNIWIDTPTGLARLRKMGISRTYVDLTESRRYSLGEETRDILGSVRGTVYATYLAHAGPASRTPPELREMAKEQLKAYGYAAGDKVVVRFFDAYRESEEAEKYLRTKGVLTTSSGETHDVVVLSYAEPGREVATGKQKEVKVDPFEFQRRSETSSAGSQWLGERVITGAVQELVFTRLKAYAVGGHGEKSLGEEMRGLRERLRSQNVDVVDRPLDFASSPEVPDDCDLLLVLSPRAEYGDLEQQAIERWLDKGRTLFVALDVDETGRRRTTGLERLLSKHGMSPRVNYVVVAPFLRPMAGGQLNVEMRLQFVATAQAQSYGGHLAVEPLRRGTGFATLFVNSSFVEVDEDPPEGLDVEPVVWAPDYATKEVPRPYAARVSESRRDFSAPNPAEDKIGARLPLVVVATRKLADAAGARRDARVIVSADADAFSDQVTEMSGANLDLFGGLVQWGLRREELVSVSAKTLEQEWTDTQPRGVRMAFWWPLVTALTALLAGAAVWWARRR
jgi:hypothetical protein